MQQHHLPALQKLRERGAISVGGCFDLDTANTDLAAGALAAERTGASPTPRRGDGIDAALIATPPSSHAALANAYLRAGKSVLVEKPFTTTATEAVELLDARSAGQALAVNHYWRFFPSVQVARALLAEDEVGRIKRVEATEGSRWGWNPTSNYVSEDPFGGVIHDVGSHLLDTVLFLLGLDDDNGSTGFEIDKVSTVPQEEPSHECRGQVVLAAEDERVTVDFAVSRLTPLAHAVKVWGSDGLLLVPTSFGAVPLLIRGDTSFRVSSAEGTGAVSEADCFLLAHEEFLRAAGTGTAHPVERRPLPAPLACARFAAERAPMSRTVVVFGASSYVGSGVVPRLLADGFDVVAVAHRPTAVRVLLPPASPQFSVLTARELGSLPADIDIVNLARVRDLLPDSIYRENRRLARSVEEAARGRCRRLIHTSTMAVFGGRLSDAAPRKLRWRPIGPYEESKLLAERAMERIAAEQQCELAILRLGNVIGPGSPLWVADLAQRIMEREPLLFDGSSGYSNTTHVANTSDYISHLLAGDDLRTLPHAPYHHLAEFSARRWSELLTAMCGAVGNDLITATVPAATTTQGEQGKMLLRRVYRRLLGGYMRAGFGLIPDRPVFERLLARGRSTLTPRAPEPGGERPSADFALLRLLSTQEQFDTATVPRWKPPIDFDQACDQIADWLRTSGYSLDPRARLFK